MYPGWVITVMPLIAHLSVEPTFSLTVTLATGSKKVTVCAMSYLHLM